LLAQSREEDEMSEVLKSVDKPMDVNVWDLVCQVIESRRDPLDLVREQLSNICAQEVQASEVFVTFYSDPYYGPSFVFRDNGIGMDFTNDPKKMGRLDRFLAVAYSGHAGLSADEFGHKGLGAKLALNCRRLEIKTHSRESQESCYVFVDQPFEALRKNLQPVFKIVPGAGLDSFGTEVKVLGYERGEGKKSYDFDHVKRYLYFSTIVGHTHDRMMPSITLRINDNEETLPTGFPYLQPPAKPDWKTYILPAPIERKTLIGKTHLRVILKGGFTLETGDTKLTGPFTLTPRTSGLFLSIRGIPFLTLDLNSFRGNFTTLQYKFCRFVVECDELFDHMDFARGSYQTGPVGTGFEGLVRDCFNELAERPEWKTFLRERERQQQQIKSQSLDERKIALQRQDQKFVFLKADGKLLHRVPDNEHDALALLWKLEGAGAIPIARFESLEHTTLEGIDIIANLRLRADSDTQLLIPVEVEDTFEEFFEHGHNPNQTGAIICWRIDDSEDSRLEQSDLHYLMYLKSQDRKIPVLIISRFSTIEVRTRNK
jgi:hypothetical protein